MSDLHGYHEQQEAYQIVSDILKSTSKNKIIETELKITHSEANREDAYSIDCNYEEWIIKLEKKNIKPTLIQQSGLGNKKVFSNDRLIYVVKDDNGIIIGFVSRKKNISGITFNFTKSKIEQKDYDSVLFGLDKNKRDILSKEEALIIVPNYSDVVVARKYGVYNIVATGNKDISDSQIKIINDLGIRDIILCYDSNLEGRRAIINLIDKKLIYTGLNIRIIQTPSTPELKDVKTFLTNKNGGPEEFNKLERMKPFKWRLSQIKLNQDDKIETAIEMSKYISMEANPIAQKEMVKELSSFLDIEIDAIEEQVDKLNQLKSIEFQAKIDSYRTEINRAVKTASDDQLLHIVEKVTKDIKKSTNKKDNINLDDVLMEFDKFVKMSEDRPVFPGFVTKFQDINNYLGGIPKGDFTAAFIGIAGKPQHGKTTLINELGLSIACLNEDAIWIAFSLDDPKVELYGKMLASYSETTIAQAQNPINELIVKDAYGNPILTEENTTILDQVKYNDFIAQRKNLRNLIGKRIFAFDSENGKDIQFIESVVRKIRKQNPNKGIFVTIDNFHLIDGPGGETKDRLFYSNISGRIKNMSTREKCCIAATLELTKLQPGIVPTENDIKETGQILYDLTMLICCYTDLMDKPETSPWWWNDEESNDKYESSRKPVMDARIRKNKHKPWRGSFKFTFNSTKGKLNCINTNAMSEYYHPEDTGDGITQVISTDDPMNRFSRRRESTSSNSNDGDPFSFDNNI